LGLPIVLVVIFVYYRNSRSTMRSKSKYSPAKAGESAIFYGACVVLTRANFADYMAPTGAGQLAPPTDPHNKSSDVFSRMGRSDIMMVDLEDSSA
jgi:hypothetical protein